jgi:cytochrome c554/c'-like protein
VRRLAAIGSAALIALAAFALLRSPRGGGSRGPDGSSGGARLLTVAFSGEDLGRLEPCGCTPAMLGGLARRPARLAASAEPGVRSVFVSGGMLVEGAGDYDRLRLGAILRALGEMQCAAFAPARREFALGLDTIARAADESRLPFVAANVEAVPARPALLRRHVTLPSSRVPVYATGLCAPGTAAPGFAVTDPLAALKRLRGELPPDAAIVVLADMDRDAARALAAADAGPIVVLHTGGRTDPFDDDVVAGRRAVAPLPAKGKFVGLAHLVDADGGAAWEVEYRPVLPDLPEDPAVKESKAAHLQALLAGDFVHRHSGDARLAVGARPAGDDFFAGSEACADCHAADTNAWKASRHAKAIESLRKTGDDADPGCVRCHVVGYGTGRGFAAAEDAPPLGSVGCESCHGARGRHAEERRAGRADARGPAATERTCLPCHDGEHDPQFDYAPRWAQIVHGGK